MSREAAASSPDAPSRHDRVFRGISYASWGAVVLTLILTMFWPEPSWTPAHDARFEQGAGTGDEALLEAAEDDGQMEVAEDGFSVISGDNGGVVGWGAMLSNSSEVNAVAAELTIRFLDEEGEAIPSADTTTISEILPGEEVGIGGVGGAEDAEAVKAITIKIEQIEWFRLDNTQREFAEVTTSEVSTGTDTDEWGDENLHAEFRVDSQYELIADPFYAVLFRDEDGEILAGSTVSSQEDPPVPPGASLQSAMFESLPPEAVDGADAEVYVYTGQPF